MVLFHMLVCNLAFNHYIDEGEFLDAIYIYVKDHFELNWDSLSQKLFNPFDFIDNESDESDIPLNDVGPDLNFYNEMFGSFSTICNYHDEDSFNDKIPNDLKDYQCPLPCVILTFGVFLCIWTVSCCSEIWVCFHWCQWDVGIWQ